MPRHDRRNDNHPAASGGRALHPLHRASGYAVFRHRHPGAAEARRGISVGRYGPRGGDLRLHGHGLGVDAVYLLAYSRRIVRPVRPAAGGVALERRIRTRLHPHGAGAESRLAVCGAGDCRDRLVELQHRRGLHCRCDAAGTAGGGVRQDRDGLRARVHSRSGAGRVARGD